MSRDRLKQILPALVGLTVGIGLLWMVLRKLRGQEHLLKQAWDESQQLWPNYLLGTVFFGLALLIRAHRCQVLLGLKSTVWAGFRSIVFAYSVNLVLSRIGEIVRMLNFRRYTGCALAPLASTIFIDRLLDVFCLASLLLYSSREHAFLVEQKLPKEFSALMPKFSWILAAGLVAMFITAVAGERIGRWVRSLAWLPQKISQPAGTFTERVAQSFRSVGSPGRLSYAIVSSIAIWVCYFLTFYLVIRGYEGISGHIDWRQGLFVFTCSAVGMTLPVPGGLGAYLVFTSKGLVLTASISEERAASITLFVYLVQIWIITVGYGAICYAYQLCRPPKSLSST